MKYISLLSLIIFLCNYVHAQHHSQKPEIKNLEWLIGSWERTNSKPGRTGKEIWTKESSTTMRGKGINLKGSDTLFVERLKIIATDTALYYVADVPENKQLTYFKLTDLATNSCTFENPQHDFPKKITYDLKADKLHAAVSGDGKVIDYYFVRQR